MGSCSFGSGSSVNQIYIIVVLWQFAAARLLLKEVIVDLTHLSRIALKRLHKMILGLHDVKRKLNVTLILVPYDLYDRKQKEDTE